MSDTVIRVENLGKKYVIGQQKKERYTALRDVIANGAKSLVRQLINPFGKKISDPTVEEFWALKDVSFEIKQGDRVGIIGRNGAGKSTLLKILSRITEPTNGRIRIKGRVASLLEVGTGFHPELTGRENIFLNGAILGMSKAEIKRKFDEIVAFAEVERFLDTPVKRYSSGMYVRLAFAVAAHLEPEILVVDEVLAVGDVQFQKKCLGKMEDVGKEGRTVLFVSHNIGMIRSLCQRCILLSEGTVIQDEVTESVLAKYLSIIGLDEATNGEIHWSLDCNAPGGSEMKLRSIRLLGISGEPQSTFDVDSPITVEITYEIFESLRGMRIVLHLMTQEGVIAFASTDHFQNDHDLGTGYYKTLCKIPGKLLNIGRYIVKIHAGIPNIKVLIPGGEFISFLTLGKGNHGSHLPEKWPGVVAPKLEWKTTCIDRVTNKFN
ncbi:MAG TPA: ABC transporter ATP-binding protein [Cyanobacteria bacterium UBA11162]|nr:ABC transporter ATP-binding protein [Cyanobacteria bacterium UBA11162]